MADQFTTWIADTAAAVEQASNVRRWENEIEFLAESADTLDAVLGDLAGLAAAAEAGAGTWWQGTVVPVDLVRDLQAVQDDLGRRQLRGVVARLDRFRTQAGSDAREAWRAHLDNEVGRSEDLEALAAALSAITGLCGLGTELMRSLRPLEDLRKRLPDAAALDSLSAITATLDGLEARLPDAVRQFVSAAARGGAVLSDLDAGVRNWLIENNALDSFKIVIGRPAGGPT